MIVAPVSDGYALLKTCFHACVLETPIWPLQPGEAKLAKGPLCLALQGIGTEEVEAFSLRLEEDCLLRQLAGNAFCANVCLVVLIVALLFS